VGYDAGKKVKGRKIHALVDTEGLPMRVVVHSAAIQDRDGAGLVLDKIRRRFPWLELVWADGGYNAWQVEGAVAKVPVLRVEIVKRSDDMKGFVVLPRRWVVERTFSWFGRNRRLAKDFENLAETLATFVTLARREFLGGATALATRANSMPAADRATPDPIVVLIAVKKRWRLLAVAARARAEKLLFALPKDERPEEFDDHPSMAEALSLEQRADEAYDRIIQTPAGTLAGIFA